MVNNAIMRSALDDDDDDDDDDGGLMIQIIDPNKTYKLQ